MANVTIPNLTSATDIAPSTDLMVLEQTNGTRKATLSQIFTSSATSGSGLGITSGAVYDIKNGIDTSISDINTLLGNTSIASIGDGTVTGALSTINTRLTVSDPVNLDGFNKLVGYKYGAVRELIFSNFACTTTELAGVGSQFAPEKDEYFVVMALNYGLINLRIDTSGYIYISDANGAALPTGTYILFGSCTYLH